MLIEMNGKDYDCKLVWMEFDEDGHPAIFDNRAVARCEQSEDCATCMWNTVYAEKHAKELKLRKMQTKKLEALKERNVLYPITANTLMCLQEEA